MPQFPTLQLLLAIVESNRPSPIHLEHGVWFGPSGDVKGHFFIAPKLPDATNRDDDQKASCIPIMQLSKTWPPQSVGISRGEDPVTRRRRHRRDIFELFTASEKVPLIRNVKTPSSASSGSDWKINGERKTSEITSVLVYPNRGGGDAASAGPAVDYLNAARLQQFCDLPPPSSMVASLEEGADASPCGVINLDESQECLLLRFPSTTSADWRFTTAYMTLTMASVPQPPSTRFHPGAGDAMRLTPDVVVLEFHQCSKLLHGPHTLMEKTDANRRVDAPSGLQRRVAKIGGSLAAAFPSSLWQQSSVDGAAERLSVFLMIEGNVMGHVERLSLLCALRVPSQHALSSQHQIQHRLLSLSPLTRVSSSEDISWSADMGETTQMRHNPNVSSTKSREDAAHRHRWVMVRDEPAQPSSGSHALRSNSVGVNSSASEVWGAAEHNIAHRHVRSARPSKDPGAFLQDPEHRGRYGADCDPVHLDTHGSSRSAAGAAHKPPWQALQCGTFDYSRSPSQLHAVHPHDGVLALRDETSDETSEFEYATADDYAFRLQTGSMTGYLVAPLFPIGRDPHSKVQRAVSVEQEEANRADETALFKESQEMQLATEETNRIPLSNLCLSSKALRRLREKFISHDDQRQTPFADPFQRSRLGLLPPMAARRQRNQKGQAHSPPRSSSLPNGPSSSFLERFLSSIDEVDESAKRNESSGSRMAAGLEESDGVSKACRPAPLTMGVGLLSTSGLYPSRTPLNFPRSTPEVPLHRIKSEAEFAANTPQTWFRAALHLDMVSQAVEDLCYTAYSRINTEAISKQKFEPVRVADSVTPLTALELVYWLHHVLRVPDVRVIVERQSTADTETPGGGGGDSTINHGEEPSPTDASWARTEDHTRCTLFFAAPRTIPSAAALKSAFLARFERIERWSQEGAEEGSADEWRIVNAKWSELRHHRKRFLQRIASCVGEAVTREFCSAAPDCAAASLSER